MMEEGKFSGRDYDGTRNMKSRRWIKEKFAIMMIVFNEFFIFFDVS